MVEPCAGRAAAADTTKSAQGSVTWSLQVERQSVDMTSLGLTVDRDGENNGGGHSFVPIAVKWLASGSDDDD